MSVDNVEVFAIPDSLTERINSALASGLPMLLAYVNAAGQARLSFRGSIYQYSPDQLALWIRDPEGGLLTALPANPKLTLLYRDPAARTTVTFYGRGRVETDPTAATAIYDAIPEQEQKADPERKGRALIVDLDQIQGRTADGPLNLKRG
jgi:hypothetical protein